VVLAAPRRPATPAQLLAIARWLLDRFMGRCWLAAQLLRQLDDEMWLHRLREVSALSAIPLVACGDVYMHLRSRETLQDVLTATRLGQPLTRCVLALQPNAERHLRSRPASGAGLPVRTAGRDLARGGALRLPSG